jgi:hypothetical protein
MHHSVHSMLLRLALTAGTLLVLWAFGEPIGEAALTRWRRSVPHRPNLRRGSPNRYDRS